jgi:signal transduction histidine kinase
VSETTKVVKKFVYRYRAIFFIVGLALTSIVGVVYLFNVSTVNNVELITRTSVGTAQKAFNDLEVNTGNTLSATLEALLTNEEIAARFEARDRDGLFRLVRPLFEEMKRQNNITHWYFINPEPLKTCFLRVHSPALYDDVITRSTLDTSIKTKEFALGKELGKTALALRAVHPYYYKGKLIGYIELAMQVEDFFGLLKGQTGNEYGLLVKKKYLDHDKWASVTGEKEIRDTWDDMEHLLLAYSTCDCARLEHPRKALENLEAIPEDGMVLEKVDRKGKHFVRGIFPFYDAAGRKVGGVFVLKDITPIYGSMILQKREITGALLIFMGIITFFMIFFHKRAERELRKYRTQLEELVKARTSDLLVINKELSREIEAHKRDRDALQEECRARAEAEEKQVEAIKHVERSARMASIGVMAAGITHEINQPLNAIKVTADSIQYWHKRNPGVLPDMFVDQLNIISKSVERIVEIIQHMRTFWVVPHASETGIVDMNKVVKKALSLTGRQLHAHGIRERLSMDTKPVTVEGNRVHFEQIIINLVVNAVHALDEQDNGNNPNYGDKEIKITTRRLGEQVELVIEDNGPGLPTEDPEKLFDPFFSTYNGSGGEGMGLGLAIVKRYIDRYGGTIDARNIKSSGAVFTIKFPFAEKQ